MQKYIKMPKEIPWDDETNEILELRNKIKSGNFSQQKSPIKLFPGLWKLHIDQGIYLIATSEGLLLIDPGLDSLSRNIEEQIIELEYTLDDVKWVLFTHSHIDHAQSAEYWGRSGKKLLIHKNGKKPIESVNDITAWYLESETTKPVTSPIVTFKDADLLSFGNLDLHVIHTPGHTPCSCCFYFNYQNKHILLSQDIALHNGRNAWMGNPYANYSQYLKSLWKINNYFPGNLYKKPFKVDMLLPGHGSVSLNKAWLDIQKTIATVSFIIYKIKNGKENKWIDSYELLRNQEKYNLSNIIYEY